MRFRKLPVEIEAVQYTQSGGDVPGVCYCDKDGYHDGSAHVHTLEGTSYDLTDGDWVIRGVKGEYYPCKPDIFEQTYERV